MAVSDQQGAFQFGDLPDGIWSLEVEKTGFMPERKEVAVGAGLPGPAFELKILPLDRIATAPPLAAPAASEPAAATPKPAGAAAVPAVANPKPAGDGSQPTVDAATAFQRTDLNASGNAPDLSAEAEPEITGELTQRAADGFLINGSAMNAAASPFGLSPSFGNFRRIGGHLYTGAISFVDTNSALDAANYSLTGQRTPKPPFNDTTGTFSFGGPLRIPHLLERNGPQFTLNYSRAENRSSRVQTSLMPDPAERTGDFSQALYAGMPVTICDPTDGNPFPGNVIPPLRISQQALALMQYYPAPNFSSGIYNYQIPLIGNTHADNLNARLSKNFVSKNLISGLLAVSDTRSDTDSQFNFLDRMRSLGINSTLSYRRTFTPRFFGTLTYQFSRQSNQLFPFFADRQNVSGQAGISGNNQSPLNWGPPALQFNQSSFAGLSDGTASVTHNQTSAISYTSSWNRNRHNVSFGGDYRWQQFNRISQSNPRGTFTFTGGATAQVSNGFPAAGTGFDFADFLLGIPDASAIAFGNADKYFRAKQSDLFVQDDWRVGPGLSLNLGVRWEYTSPVTEKYNRLVNLDIAPGFTAIAPVVANGASGPRGPATGLSYPDSLIRPDYREIEPRLAFAWRPSPNSSMVVRGGYGVSYNTQAYQQFANLMAQQSPLSTSLNLANTAANPLTLASGFYAPPNVFTNTAAIDPSFRIGYAQVWNLTVQRDLPAAMQLVATYTGTKGTRQLQAFAPNTYPPGATNPCPSCLSGYTYYTSNGNSTREAGILQLRRRLHNGFQAQVQYTYSKSIDDATTPVAQNWLNLSGERGRSNLDQRNLAHITLQYTSGMGVGGGTLVGGWRGRLVKDWTLAASTNFGSGLPLTPIYSQLIPGTGIPGNLRASYTGAPLYEAPEGYFLNPAAVAVPAPGQWGNADRNSITGPGQFSMTASLSRAFRLTDRFTLNLRVEANNPLNHPVVTQLNTTVTNPLFGLPLGVNAMRTVSTNLRLTF